MAKSRTKRTTISRSLADKFTQKIEQLPEKKKTELTPKELIFENSKQLDNLLERGYTYDDLVALLREDGIQLSKVTLRQYLSEARKTRDNQGRTTEDLPIQPGRASVESSETATRRSPDKTKRASKKLGKSRLQTEENSARYPDGHGTPIEMKTDL